MIGPTMKESRQRELWRRLEQVNDPELDEPVTEMGFIERAEIADDGKVEVDFRLPTYWCSPNFAFLMLEDIRTALEGLSWSPPFHIALHDHMFAEEVNNGIALGKSFADIFGSLAEDIDLEPLRAKFRLKAFQRRQEAVILGFRETGASDAEITGATLADLDARTAAIAGDGAQQMRRYRDALLARWPNLSRRNRVIVDWDGVAVEEQDLASHLADLRSVRINMEFNGAICRGLKTTRYKEMDLIDGEPTLVDFIVGRVPARCDRTHTTTS